MRTPTALTTLIVTFFLFPPVSRSPAHAAGEIPEGAVERTIAASLKPVIELFGGNLWLQGLSVILVTFMVASVIIWLLFKILRQFTSRTRLHIDDQIITLLRPPLYYTFLVSGISYGISLMPLAEGVQVLLTRSIQSLGVLVWVIFFIRLASLVLTRVATLGTTFAFVQQRTVTLFDNMAKIVIFSIGIYALFVIWKIDMTAWLASAGIAGIAVGFAAKDTLSNLFSGVFILADAPYKVGDYILLDRGERGKVTNIGLRSTRILTRDDVEITIPNSIIGNTTIINQSGGPTEKLRVKIPVGVAYGTDTDLVRKIMLDIAGREPLVCKTPQPRVRFRVFGASSLDFELLCWAGHPEMRGQLVDALNDAIYKAFTAQGIEIPYAKQDLYIKGLPEGFLQLSSRNNPKGRDVAGDPCNP